MMAYREAPPAAGLPFPRRHLPLYTASAIILAALVLVLPLPVFASPGGFRMFKEGGSGMFILLFVAAASAAALGAAGAFAVRGKRAAAAAVAAIPAVVVVVGALFASLGMRRAIGAVEGESVDPSQAMRILAEGTAESDVLFIFGCLMGGAAFGAAAVALLGSAASIDRARAGSGATRSSWIAPLAIGLVGVVVALGLRVALKTMLLPMMLVIPSLGVVTIFATLAARNATLVRGWHDALEANGWLASVLAAAMASAVGVVLLDLSASFLAERSGLGAIAGESVDASQKARILFQVIEERHAAHVCACVDGVLAFATVASGLVGAFGRGPDGSKRAPLGAPPLLALTGVLVVIGMIAGARSWASGGVDRVAAKGRLASTVSDVTLPEEPTGPYAHGDPFGPGITVNATGRTQTTGEIASYTRTITVTADRTARWTDVARAIRSVLSKREGSGPLFLAIRVAPQAPAAPVVERLGAYGRFLGPGVPAIRVELEAWSKGQTVVANLPATADMDFVVQEIARRSAVPDRSYDPPVVVLASPTGFW